MLLRSLAPMRSVSSSSLPGPPKALHILPSRRVSLQGGFGGAHSPAAGSLGP